MTTKDGRFLPSLALALTVHALLLLLLSRALAHPVFEARGAVLEVQIASLGSASAGSNGTPAVTPARKPRDAPPPALAAPRAPLPSREVSPDEVPRSEVTSPPAPPTEAVRPEVSRPAPSPLLPEDPAASLPAGSNAADAASAPAAAAGEGRGPSGNGTTATASPGASARVGEASVGGSGYESAEAGNGRGAATFEADIDPVLLRSIQAAYPAAARNLGQEGTVRVLAEIGTDGTVISDEVYSSSGHRMLDSAALAAVKKARFLPALKNGKPVTARLLIPVRFRLTD